MKKISNNEMASIEAGAIVWSEFADGACRGFAIASFFVMPAVGFGVGVACALFA